MKKRITPQVFATLREQRNQEIKNQYADRFTPGMKISFIVRELATEYGISESHVRYVLFYKN
jgi:hypothetical protein